MNINEKILVLGADGFIGGNLTKCLMKKNNIEVIAFDLFRDNKARNIPSSKNLKLFSGNFLNKDDLRRALSGVDYVFHLISLTTPGSSMNDPLIDVETNIKGTITLLDECVKSGVKRVIFSSSGGAIYGNQESDGFSEDDKTNPISPYAISKLTIEKYLEYYRVHFGLEYLILRYSNPYGPGQNVKGSQGVIPIFLNLVKNDDIINVFGNGENIRDYIFIDDLIDMTLRLYDQDNLHRIYNVGSGESFSINDIIAIIRKITMKDVNVKYLPARSIDVDKVRMDTKRVFQEIGKKKMSALNDGVKKTWDWIISLD